MKLKKIALTILIFVLAVLFGVYNKTVIGQAETTTPPPQDNTQAAFSQICLNMTTEDQTGADQSNADRPMFQADHTTANFTASGSGFDIGAVVYPFLCVLKGTYVAYQAGGLDANQPVCTTGNYTNDQKLFCKPGESCPDNTHNPDVPEFTLTSGVSTNGTAVSQDGTISIGGTITNPKAHVQYIWYGGYFKGDTLATGGITEIPQGQDNTVQQGTFPFEKINATAANVKTKCVTVHWDPYGRVFDSRSLEPMVGIDVRLLSSINPEIKFNLIRGENPTQTTPDGVFNFIVPQGIYYLRLSGIPSTHTFSNIPNLNPLYLNIYHQKRTGGSSLYLPDAPINELIDTPEEQAKNAPDLEERDIALDPGSNSPYVGPIISINHFQSSNSYYTTYFGKSSHPYPIVKLVRADDQKVVFQQEFADEEARYGYWQTNIVNSQIPSDTPLELILIKNPKYFTDTNPETSVESGKVIFEPIARNLQGYLKDSSGQPMANTEIKVILDPTNSVYSTVKTDANGLFKLPASRLPLLSYHLKVTDPVSNVSVIKSVSSVIAENKDYLKEQKINPMIEDKQKYDKFILSAKNNLTGNKNLANKNASGEKTGNKLITGPILVLLFVIALLIASVVTLVVFHFKNKSSPMEQSSQF